MPEAESETILGAKWAVRLCAALLIGFAGVTGFAIYDRSQRENLEQVIEPTALGDTAFFQPPEKFASGSVFTQFRGQPLYPTGTERHPLHDGKMQREGKDDANAHWIYRSTERGGVNGDYFFLKVARDQYLEVSRERMPE